MGGEEQRSGWLKDKFSVHGKLFHQFWLRLTEEN